MEKSHFNVRIAGKPLLLPDSLDGMKEITLERHPLYVRSLAKPWFV
jgi:hypothetical protein